MADGTITFRTDLDNKELVKSLEQTERKLDGLNRKLRQSETQKLPLVRQAEQLVAKLDEARAKLDEMQNAPKGTFSTDQVTYQKETVGGLNAVWSEVQKKVDACDRTILQTNQKIEDETIRAKELQQALTESAGSTERMRAAAEKAKSSMATFALRMKAVVRSALIFTVITQALAKLRTWIGKVIKSNAEARASIAKLKGALLTLAQPLVEVVIPAFIAFVNVAARVISAIAKIVSAIFGKTIDQSKKSAESLYDQTEAIDGVGASAKKASKSLAAFDEINTLDSGEDGADGSGGAAASDAIEPDFSWMDDAESKMQSIESLVGLIAAGLLGWKIGAALGLGLKGILGFALAIYSAIQFVKGIFDAWTNGVDWSNITEMLLGAAGIAIGLGIALGPVAAGISLIVTGLAMLATGFRDAAENGWNLQNLFLSVAGILAAGLGIAIITGTWIPLLIAAIAGLLLAFTVNTGHGKELIDGIKEAFQGFVDFFTGLFTGDMEKAMGGIEKIFSGLKKIVFSVIDGVKDSFLSFLTWIDEKTHGKLHGIIEFVKNLFSGMFNAIKETAGNLIDSVKTIFGGIIKFITGVFKGDWDSAWEGIKDIFKGCWNGILSLLYGVIGLIIDGLNWLIRQMNKIQFDVPSWVPLIGGKSLGINIPKITKPTIPALATGAVIPPNREFMAMLGDQKSGTNIEAPLDTIVEAFRQASGDRNITIQFEGSMAQLVKALRPVIKQGDKIYG